MLNLAHEEGALSKVPKVKTLEEDNVKTGFLEQRAHDALMAHLPDHLKPIVTMGYLTAWRLGELRSLKWDHIDLREGIITLPVGFAKNKKGRTIPASSRLLQMLKKLRVSHGRKALELGYVFLNKEGTGPLKGLRDSWNKACREAGIGYGYAMEGSYTAEWSKRLPPGPTFHDLRRSGIRNMIRSKVPETVAMKISGHSTRSVFDRYNITSVDDVKIALQQAEDRNSTLSDEIQKEEDPKVRRLNY